LFLVIFFFDLFFFFFFFFFFLLSFTLSAFRAEAPHSLSPPLRRSVDKPT